MGTPITRVEVPAMMSPRQVADYLGVKQETLTKWRQRGIGPKYVKLNQNFIRYPAGSLVEWFRESLVVNE